MAELLRQLEILEASVGEIHDSLDLIEQTFKENQEWTAWHLD